MPIDPKFFKAVIVTIFIALGAFVGYQLVTDDDAKEASDTFEEIQREEDGGYYDESDVADFEASLGASESLESGQGIEFFNYFEHTAPGEYSEIFVEITGFEPKVQKIVYIRNADTGEYISVGGQDMVTTDLGHISTRFRITSYGNYEVVTYDNNSNEITSPILVVN